MAKLVLNDEEISLEDGRRLKGPVKKLECLLPAKKGFVVLALWRSSLAWKIYPILPKKRSISWVSKTVSA